MKLFLLSALLMISATALADGGHQYTCHAKAGTFDIKVGVKYININGGPSGYMGDDKKSCREGYDCFYQENQAILIPSPDYKKLADYWRFDLHRKANTYENIEVRNRMISSKMTIISYNPQAKPVAESIVCYVNP